jgi:PKD repeat protein
MFRKYYAQKSICSIFVLCGVFGLTAQAQVFVGQPVKDFDRTVVDSYFKTAEVYQIDAEQLYQQATTVQDAPLHVRLGTHDWVMHLQPNPILAANYVAKFVTDQGTTVMPYPTVRPYKGYMPNGTNLRLTLDHDLVYGMIEDQGELWYIEPLRYLDPAAPADHYVVYERGSLNKAFNPDRDCAAIEQEEMVHRTEEDHVHDTPDMMACYQVDLAIASDNSMLLSYGSEAAVEAHNVAVLNNVTNDYTGNFNHDIQFNIVTQLVASNNPWGASSNAGTYLGNFRIWGNNGGFGIPYDLAEMWTDIDFDGSTIGVAYLSALCTTNKYHILQDFTSNAELLRCLTSHEIGHNFSANHDACSGGQEFIMCPFVTTSTDWSANSVSSISNHITSRINNGCLQVCSTGAPPTAAFSWNPDPGCTSQQVNFTDESFGTINTRNWVFPGGTPATSTAQNPVVTWATPGVKNVTLTLNQGAGNQVVLSQQVTVVSPPTASFTFARSGMTYTFTNVTTNATGFLWDFGDGETSVESNPTHTYQTGNIYTVTLSVTGVCGDVVRTITINTLPTPEFSSSSTTGCAPESIDFYNLSSPNAVGFLWQFEGGTPAVSNLAAPTVTYTVPGTYNVTLTATNITGLQNIVKTDYITIGIVPTANFTYAATGNAVSFQNQSLPGQSYLWDFGDGTTSSNFNVVHQYATGGTYLVSLTVTNDCGTNTTTQTIVLATGPLAGFTTTPSSGCGPLTVQFTNTTTGAATSYAWQFPGGSPATSTAVNPSVTYSTPGTYTVTLTAANGLGTNTQTATIQVFGPPAAAFGSVVNGNVAQFANQTTGTATAYSWNFGDPSSGANNTSSAAAPSHVYATDGTYTVTLTATGACGSTTATQTVTIVTPPTAGYSVSNATGCGPLTVQFTNTSTPNATTYAWQFPGGSPATSSAPNPSVTYSLPGTYTATLVASNSAGSTTSTQQNVVTVLAAPTAGFTAATNGQQVTMTNASAGATSYAWAFGDGNTSTSAQPVHTYANAATYTITLTATSTCGTATATQIVTILQTPTASATASVTAGCAPFTTTFSSTSTGQPSSLAWQFPGGSPATSTAANPTVTYALPGTYNVILTATNGAGSGTVTLTNYITVTGPPASAAFSSQVTQATATFTQTATGATSFGWQFGDGGTSALPNPVHTYTTDGTYTVTLTASNGCGTMTSTQVVTIVTPPLANFTAVNRLGCTPLTVQFTNASSANATQFLWQFPGGVPATSTEANPTVVYNTPGQYDVSLQASNSAGSPTVTQTGYITVTTVPQSVFTATVQGTLATMTNQSTGATAYTWNFGDGSPTNNQVAPTHTYANDGTYTVTLTASNNCGTTTSTQTVTITTPPAAGFTVGMQQGCAPLTVQFTNTSSANATTFEWEFPGGSPATSTLANPVVIYSLPGTYSATLVASNGVGENTSTQTDIVTVGQAPQAAFTYSVSGTVVIFVQESAGATSYQWAFGDGSTSTDAAPTHTYTTDGTYTVTLKATNACGTVEYVQVVTIVTPPFANFLPTSASGCAELTVQYQNMSSANTTSVVWSFPGGTPSTSTEQNPVVVYTTPGLYSASLTATNAAGSISVNRTDFINVSGLPIPDFQIQTAGTSVVLTNTSTDATSYLWNFGDGTISNEANPIHNYGTTGTYPITLVVTNACGTNTLEQTVVIEGAPPISNFNVQEKQPVGCAPLTLHFLDNSVGGPATWAWTFEGGQPATSNEQNPTVTYSQAGTYGVSLTTTNAFGPNTSTQSAYVTVLDMPSAAFGVAQQGAQIVCTPQAVGAFSYAWDFGDGSTSTEPNPTHTFTANGTYTVQLTISNSCGQMTENQSVVVDVISTDNPNAAVRVRLFPNPNAGDFNVEMEGLQTPTVVLRLHNVLGQEVWQAVRPVVSGRLTERVRVPHAAAGVYLLQVQQGQSVVTYRVVIE